MKYVYEFIGTFFLVLTIGLSVLNEAGLNFFAPVAIGSILAVMIYAGAHISGAHYNPAISLAVFLRGKLSFANLGLYWLFQLLGAVAAAYTVLYLKGGSKSAMNLSYAAILAEFLFTFALCYVMLNVATTKATEGNSYFGFAIGFTVLAGAYAVGSISGGAFNPAVALAASIMNFTSWHHLWMFIAGNLAGAVAAALVYNAAQGNKLINL